MAGENTDPKPNDPPAGDPPAADPPPANPPGNPPADPPTNIINMTSEQLDERLSRARSAHLRELFGTDDPTEIKAQISKAKELEEAEEQRKREQLSKEEQLQADLEAERARAAAAQEERDAVAFENHITRTCAELGVKNVDFAMWEVARKADELPDGEQLDAKEHLQSLLENDQSRAALGVTAPVTTEPTPATTSPAGGPGAEPNPDQGPPAPDGDVFNMNKEDWAAKKARLGIQ